MSNKQLTRRPFAILGLLSIEPFTNYELAQQMDRTLSWFWPRRPAWLEEPKKPVTAGFGHLAGAASQASGVAPFTDIAVDSAALRDWLDTPADWDAHGVRGHDQGGVRRRGRCESATFGSEGNPGRRLRRDSLKSSPADQHSMQPQAAHSQTDCQSLRSAESCSWVNTRLLSGGPNGPKTPSVNGLASRRQLVRRCRLTPLLPSGPPPTPNTPSNIGERRQRLRLTGGGQEPMW